MSTPSYGLHWFRRDLRVAGNGALQWSWKEHQGRVLGLFCFDSKFLARPDFSHDRFAFFLDSLRELRLELRQAGGDLLVMDQGPREGFERLFAALKAKGRPAPATVSFNRDYEPFARERDRAVTSLLEGFGAKVHTERDHLIVEPTELFKDEEAGSYYQVYTPFARRWFALFQSDRVQGRVTGQKAALKYLKARAKGERAKLFSLTWDKLFAGECPLKDHFDETRAANLRKVSVPIPPAGSLAALARLSGFKKKLSAYGKDRDFPALDATSQMSLFFKNGSLTPALALAELGLEGEKFQAAGGGAKFLMEVVWREFYYHILWHCPRVEKEAFLERYKALKWENREDYFKAWKEGKTGYPIVDAGMRQLRQTGWMHNRVRMITASFLTKDLLIDWRWGEKYFMEKLLDGDLAPNNGGWQWAASTGCDPQPYFRVFNPKLQGERFDPEGLYIKKYVPELAGLNPGQIHAPDDSNRPAGYPAPIVDHARRKDLALALYRGTQP
ncbi:MAG TPA: deoxyribodipyrimidine photo-lyase [bacterium]|nr:deoxyribodipyrimidine photo-lyase [bacterium]